MRQDEGMSESEGSMWTDAVPTTPPYRWFKMENAVSEPSLTEFLLARIADREVAARKASRVWGEVDGECDWRPGEPAVWATTDEYGVGAVERTNGTPRGGIVVYDEGSPSDAEAYHIALNDPAYVLAECEAKRRIVATHARHMADCPYDPTPRAFDTVGRWSDYCDTLRLLALPYANHPDYRQEWKP